MAHVNISDIRWHHRIEVAPGVVTPGVYDCDAMWRLLALPENLSGKRVLDIGARDGYYTFQCERRGAEVIAIDYSDQTGFNIAREMLSARSVLLKRNLFELSVDEFGRFDVILFLGVLYHLQDPMRGINALRTLMKPAATLYVESHIEPGDDLTMRFYPRDTNNRDHTNYWGPTVPCLQAMLEECELSVIRTEVNGARALCECRQSEDPTLHYFNSLASIKFPAGL
jgi:tRNA (mo5U34)-methyltransferase